MAFIVETAQDLVTAITFANLYGGAHTINLQPRTYYVGLVNNQADGKGENGFPAITSQITINGNGATITRSQSAPLCRFFYVAPGGELTLKGLTLKGGKLDGTNSNLNGGAIYNRGGILTLNQCVVTGNYASNRFQSGGDGYGGAICSDHAGASGSTLIINNSTISDNEAATGGGIYNGGSNGIAIIANSTISKNVGARGFGGGGFANFDGSLTIDRCDLFDNTAITLYGDGNGGVIYIDGGSLFMTYSSMFQNRADYGHTIYNKNDGSTVIVNYNRIFGNPGSTGNASVYNNGTDPIDFKHNWWGADNGPSGDGPGSGDAIYGNVLYAPLAPPVYPPVTGGGNGCGSPTNARVAYTTSDSVETPNPISLRFGEPRIRSTDLTLQSPVAPLTFERTYRQSTQNEYQFMGLGWTHNHAFELVIPGILPDTDATVRLPDGSILSLTEDPDQAGHFIPGVGSSAMMDYDDMADIYTLIGEDKTIYVFDGTTLLLQSRSWPSNESWTYEYYESGDGSDLEGKLKQVSDAYDRYLQFTYIRDTDPDEYKRQQLWRVGDHTADGLDGNSPTGRYIEFEYVPESEDGSPVTGRTPLALLFSVQDVRGNTWEYDYYGQASSETTPALLNRLQQRRSPSVDTTGDGTPDSALVLENLTYISNVELDLAVNGDMERDGEWTSLLGIAPFVNERSNTQVDSGSYARHIVADLGQGIEGNVWNLIAGKSYVITARVYPISGGVQMRALGTSAFDDGSTGTDAWETLTATYTPSDTVLGCRLQFVATDDDSEFYVDTVSIIETNTDYAQITQDRGGEDSAALLSTILIFAPHQNLTRETTVGLSTDHRFDQTQYLGKLDAAGNYAQQAVNNVLRPSVTTDANGNNTRLNWDEEGKFLLKVADAAGQETSFDYNLSGDSADTLNYSIDAEGRKTQYEYEDSSNPRLPTRIQVLDAEDNILRWQEFTYDSYGRTLTETSLDPNDGITVLQGIIKTYVSSGDGAGLLESVTIDDPLASSTTYTYDTFGRVIKTAQSSLFGTCQFSYSVYDEAGNVVATVCGRQGTTPPTTVGEALDMYDAGDEVMKDNNVTTHEYDSLGRRVKTTTRAGSDFEQTTLTVYDAIDRVIRTISNYVPDVSLTNPYTASPTAFDHGVDNTANWVSDITYNDRGLVRSQMDVLGNVTLFGYDDAGRLVKTIQNASDPDYNNDYADPSPDPTLEAYVVETDADTDIVTSQAYDAVGNLVKTVDALGNVNYTVYDVLNRPIKTIRAAKDNATLDLNPGDDEYEETNDPRSDAYVMSADPDRDLIDLTFYDSMGRVIRTQHLLDNRPSPKWETTLFGFDLLGRQVRTIRNVSQPAYDVAVDPSLVAYPINPDPDKDIVTQTVYEASGRVLYTEDTLGSKTWFAYDSLGRQVKTIANAVGNDTDDGDEDPRSDSYIVSSDTDKDLITATVYDSDGRVQSTEDVLGRVNYNLYDASGRLFRTITNFVPQHDGLSREAPPATWYWDGIHSQWAADIENTAPTPPTVITIGHGEQNDQNIIAETVYDGQGRVSQTLDTRRNATQLIYDSLGRRIATITNYVEQANPPEAWEWSTGNNRWEDGDSTAIDFGSDNDQNRITTMTYDLGGRVSSTRDTAGMETRFEYDALGRRVSTILNYVDGVFDTAHTDEDLISTTVYNKAGQVVSTTDVRETETAFTYDAAGRRLTITRAATTELASTDYTCYDKAGRILRTIQNWSNGEDSPDAKDTVGNWSFAPETHGVNNDQNLMTSYLLDSLGRTAQIVDALGHETLMRYDKAGQLVWQSDPNHSVSRFFYDQAHRRQRVIQGYLPIPLDEHITYVSRPSGNNEIFSMTNSGSSQTNLTGLAGSDEFPHWSPDDNQIVFASNRAGVSPDYFSDIYRMEANGDNPQQLTDLSGFATEPAWSPDGGQIAFSFKPGDRTEDIYDLYLMNADGSNLRLLYADTLLSAGRPKWSPEGQRIAFHGSDDEGVTSNIYVIHADGTQLVNLTNRSDSLNQVPVWSWDGSQIAFHSSWEGNYEIYVMNADGSNAVNVSGYSGADEYAPDWSPDGSRMAFYSTRNTANGEVYVMHADGTVQTRLTTNSNYNQAPVWSKQVVDPMTWVWNGTNDQWEYGEETPIPHGTDHDRNIIVDVTYDKAGRVAEQREPLGHVTSYEYDDLNRRISLTNPLENAWTTAYEDLESGGTSVTLSYPGINDDPGYNVQRNFDRLGRLVSMVYGDASHTPDFTMTYDAAGNRVTMSEFDEDAFAHLSRETSFSYDALHRLTAAAFDTDADTTPDETVSYAYDAGGLRTQLTLPDDLTVTYHYDARGRLILMTDWDNQVTELGYDLANRHIETERTNGLHSTYDYDAAGQLKLLRHVKDISEIVNAAPFSGTNILDDFNRADGSLGANWERADSFAIDNNQVVLFYDARDMYWVGERYGLDQEVFVTLSSINESSEDMSLLLKAQGTYTFAEISVHYNPTTHIAQVWTYTIEDDWILHGADIAVTFEDGDQFGARAFRDGTVEVYKNGVLLGKRDVRSWPHFAEGGYIGIFFYLAEDTLLDDFGGGNILVSAPGTSVLDAFNRSDGSIGTNWSGATTHYAIDSNQLIPSDQNDDIYWNGERFGPNQEAYVTLVTINPSGGDIDLVLKRQSSDWTDGVLTVVYTIALHRIQLYTYDSTNEWVQRGTDIDITFEDGDVMGAKARSNGTVEIYKNGLLMSIQSITEWPYFAEGGYIGLMTLAVDTVLDDFGGGSIPEMGASSTLAHFTYEVDARGNRTQALEILAQPETSTDTVIAYDDSALVLTGTWSEVSGFVESTDTDANLKFMFLADHITLSMGKGPDHSIYEIYLNGELWQSVDGYAASATQEDIEITSSELLDEGPHILEVRNQNDKNASSSGYKVRFQQATITDKAWDLHTIAYNYDALARLKEARYNPGINTEVLDADLLRQYRYAFDRAGNRTQQSVAVNGGSPTVTNYTYIAANQLVSDGTNTLTYDNNGNLTSDGVNSYTWDRANRLLTWDNGVAADLVNHAYDGEGRRVSQAVGTTSPTITKYLLEIQPGLAVVLSQTEGSDVTRFVHAPRGIHARQDASNDWHWTVQDGLGTVRVETDNSVAVEGSQNLDPFGNLIDLNGTIGTPYAFTGELVDGSRLLDLRARRYNAGLGVFASLDPLETPNRYAYVSGNPVNFADPTGLTGELPGNWVACYPGGSGPIVQPQPTPFPPTPAPQPVSNAIKSRIISATVKTDFCDHTTKTCEKGEFGLGTLVNDYQGTGVGLLTHTHQILYSVGSSTLPPPVIYDPNGTLVFPPNTLDHNQTQGNLVPSTFLLFNQLKSAHYDIKITDNSGANFTMDLSGYDWTLGGYSDAQGKMHIVPGSGIILTNNPNPLSTFGQPFSSQDVMKAQDVIDFYPNADIYFAYLNRSTSQLDVMKAGSNLGGPFIGGFFLKVYAFYPNYTIQQGDSGGGVYADIGGDIKYIGIITLGNVNPQNGRQVLQLVGI